ncbi:hypothetical protein [Solemya elarraichensis gill symbiont]|uniref:Uncharacterized protein n=1 Tax=Solemya elarraichensis gill symbiont TaxID=1918949 RepID=A0A1T2KZH3_9GAMM|nr:hypothetical protein [Solemya elarraichensis gill symbiont]OOZ38232.1 hypothetical protein BOW52_09000 [Solemya elarraichensis gill symbiont]
MRLDNLVIERISSPYLDGDRKIEAWQIEQVDIEGDELNAIVSMSSYCVSDADTDGFHLSYITALEFVSQLQIIYMHVWAGLEKKTQEAWMVECRMKSHSPIRNPNAIKVHMTASRMRKRGDVYYCIADHRVTDDQGGLFEIWIKALMS